MGVDTRLSGYDRVNKGLKKPEKGRHADWLIRKDVTMDLHCIAVFNSCETPKPYVLLMELLSTILLQTLPLSDGGRYRNASAVEMVRKATPQNLPGARHTPLNGAVQGLQGLYRGRRKADEVCLNCSTRETCQWCSANPGLPFTGRICAPSYNYRRYNDGKDRPPELEIRRADIKAMRAQLGEKPAAGARCPGCGLVSSATQWYLPKGDHASEPGRQRWECCRCSVKPIAKLPVWDEGTADEKARQRLLRAAEKEAKKVAKQASQATEKAAKKAAKQQSLEPSHDGPPDQSTQELAVIRANQDMIIEIGSGQAQTIDLLNLTLSACDLLDREAKAFHHIHEHDNDAINTILLFLRKTCEKGTQ